MGGMGGGMGGAGGGAAKMGGVGGGVGKMKMGAGGAMGAGGMAGAGGGMSLAKAFNSGGGDMPLGKGAAGATPAGGPSSSFSPPMAAGSTIGDMMQSAKSSGIGGQGVGIGDMMGSSHGSFISTRRGDNSANGTGGWGSGAPPPRQPMSADAYSSPMLGMQSGQDPRMRYDAAGNPIEEEPEKEEEKKKKKDQPFLNLRAQYGFIPPESRISRDS